MIMPGVRILVFSCVLPALAAVPSRASDPVGIYGIVEKVVFEPNETSPQRIQIWGAFAIADGKPGSTYLPAKRGYLYFSLPSGKEEVARKEWADLKNVAGTGQGVAFARRYDLKANVRKSEVRPQSPDVYPLGFGIQKMHSEHRLLDELRSLKNLAGRESRGTHSLQAQR